MNYRISDSTQSLRVRGFGVLTDDDGAEDDEGYDGLQGDGEDFSLGPGRRAAAGFG